MSSLALWLSGPALQAVLLVRAAQGKFLNRYKFFYSYVVWVLLQQIVSLWIYKFRPASYALAYWSGEAVSVLAGCGLVWEAYKIALARYPGASRVARNVLLFVFIFAVTRILVHASNTPNWIPGKTTLETELDLRVAQAAMLIVLVALFAYYAIPLGRNLKGIVYGYAFFLTSALVNLGLRDFLGARFQSIWHYAPAASYLLVLFYWCWALWSYAPIPQPSLEPRLEADYETLLAKTRGKLSSARARLLRDTRP
jgi:hypothetical protein